MYLLHLLGRLEIFSILFNTTNLHNFKIYVLPETPIDHLFFDSCLFLIEIIELSLVISLTFHCELKVFARLKFAINLLPSGTITLFRIPFRVQFITQAAGSSKAEQWHSLRGPVILGILS